MHMEIGREHVGVGFETYSAEDRDVPTFRGRRQGRKGSNPRVCEVPVADNGWALAGQNKCEAEG